MRAVLLGFFMVLAPVTLTGGIAQAADSPIKPFIGAYKGEAVSKRRDSIYFGTGLRAFGLTIKAEGDGFALVTTNTRKRSGKYKTKTTTLNFYPAKRAAVYKARQSGEPADGKAYIWAEVKGSTLGVYILAVEENGGYDLLIYKRTLVEDGLKIVFRRIRDGSPVRIVFGRAKRIK